VLEPTPEARTIGELLRLGTSRVLKWVAGNCWEREVKGAVRPSTKESFKKKGFKGRMMQKTWTRGKKLRKIFARQIGRILRKPASSL